MVKKNPLSIQGTQHFPSENEDYLLMRPVDKIIKLFST